jgi:predicted permease
MRGRDSALNRTTTSWLLIMARLNDDQTIASAEQALRGVQLLIREATMPANARPEARARYLATPFGLEPAATGTSAMRVRYGRPLLAIVAIVALVLLIASANIANLFLARAASRVHELSVRQALGASRWRLARQQLVEGVLVSVAGAAAGLAVASWVGDLLVRQFSTYANTVFLDTHLDWRVLTYTGSVAMAVALLFGVAPALRASNANPIDAMREHGRTGAGRSRGLGGALVVGQVALSLVLIVAAGLFIRTFTTLAKRDLGFERDAVLLARLDVPASGNTAARVQYEEIVGTVRGVPGVAHAAISEITPVSGLITDHYVEVDGGPALQPPRNVVYRNVITPDWFATYGMRVVAGRDFGSRDQLSAAPVTIVNETFARRFLQGRTAVGSRVRNPSQAPGQAPPWMEVVGVAADAAYLTVREVVPPTMYVPLTQQDVTRSFTFVTLSVRPAAGSPARLARDVGAAIGRVNPGVAITFVPLEQQVNAALVQERIVAMLSGSFGALAMLLSAVGLYGVTVYAVNRRRTEIGIRIAIGAAPSRVVRLVLVRVALLLSLGILIGAGASVWASRFVATLLYGLEPSDPLTLVGAMAVLLAVGAFAGWLPAYRASRIDPAEVLREG